MDRAHAFALTSPTISLIRAPNEAVCVAALFYSDDQGMSDEADFSAEQPGAGAPARLPRADGDGGRAQRAPRASQPRPQEAVGVTTLTKRRDFLAANSGKRAPMPGFVLLVKARGDGDATMRIGYTVTKKIGNAVVRNRIKRRFRALAREVLPISGVAGADHVLIGRSDGLTRDFAQLRADLAKALAKVSR
jgi:ribonuclease P protein component